MRRLLLLLVAPLVLAACGQQSAPQTSAPAPEQPTSAATTAPQVENTTAPPDFADPTPTTDPGVDADAADQYCEAVDEFLKASRKAASDPLNADTKELQEQIQNLQAQASSLAGELFDNPEGITQVTQCTQKLQEFSEAS